MALLPADTRIPDHSIWTHMQVVSALAGCVGGDNVWQPAFLKFQLGPVQDFIAAARSIRDLWSGSYLLSWLMAAGMKALSCKIGPDAVIFPNLRGQPLFDLHWKEDLWDKVKIGGKTVWEDSLKRDEAEVLTPNLPNVFLAVVPADQAADLAREVAGAIQADLSWQVTEWPDTLEAALKLADGFADGMPIAQARKRVEAVVAMAEKQMPMDHRDGRYYIGGSNGPKHKLNNIGLGWSVVLALSSWELDAVRQTRNFVATNSGGWQIGTFSNKDSLTGREEAVAGGREWVKRAEQAAEFWPSLFKKDDWLCASTLVKRVWHRSYLANTPWSLRTDGRHFPMPNTRGVAAHEPESDCEGDETSDDTAPSEKYFAVLAFDGDEIGKWISGEKTPSFVTQLADYKDGSNAQRYGSKLYFERSEFGTFLDAQRPLSPSYHLQFSEALGNFALLCARSIVEAFDGRLIYAGGDDVVALLPADTALECARALRMAFQGEPAIKEALRLNATELRDRHLRAQARAPKAAPPPYYQKLAAEGCLLHAEHRGFLKRLDLVDQQQSPIPFLVPGPAAECSVGIAIAHFKAPLQDVVRAAQAAEKRAKRKPEHGGLDRSAVAVTLMKRSGEIIEWGAKWQDGLELYRSLADVLEADQLSAKFPHRFAELLEAYVTDSTPLVREEKAVTSVENFPVDAIIRRELEHCLSRQRGPGYPKDREAAGEFDQRILASLETYLHSLTHAGKTGAEQRLRALIGLCQTVAFAHRTAADSDNHSEPKGSA